MLPGEGPTAAQVKRQLLADKQKYADTGWEEGHYLTEVQFGLEV